MNAIIINKTVLLPLKQLSLFKKKKRKKSRVSFSDVFENSLSEASSEVYKEMGY